MASASLTGLIDNIFVTHTRALTVVLPEASDSVKVLASTASGQSNSVAAGNNGPCLMST